MAKKADMLAKVGTWAFLIGVLLALIGGLAVQYLGAVLVTSVLIVLGIIVGLLNVTENETQKYLLAAVSLVIVTSLGGQVLSEIAVIGPYIGSVLSAIMTFVLPATVIVALKAIYALAQD